MGKIDVSASREILIDIKTEKFFCNYINVFLTYMGEDGFKIIKKEEFKIKRHDKNDYKNICEKLINNDVRFSVESETYDEFMKDIFEALELIN